MKKQYVFIIVKPGAQQYNDNILSMLKSEGWDIYSTKVKTLNKYEAGMLYKVHQDKPFYNDLCEYMSSGISRAYIMCREFKFSDPFKDMERIKDQVRSKYGKNDMENVMHSSDSRQSMLNEMGIYFPDFIII